MNNGKVKFAPLLGKENVICLHYDLPVKWGLSLKSPLSEKTACTMFVYKF